MTGEVSQQFLAHQLASTVLDHAERCKERVQPAAPIADNTEHPPNRFLELHSHALQDVRL
eukprot:2163718-Pleurochrysis_carterae.AAC.1